MDKEFDEMNKFIALRNAIFVKNLDFLCITVL